MGLLFGPVPSRRLGRSLGVDMVTYKTCSFNCVYCELGPTTCHTRTRSSFGDPDLLIQELKERLAQLGNEVDYITLAGSGEPTLNADLGDLVSRIKSLTKIPLAILTNSSLLPDPEVRKQLQGIDLIVPSLDAVTQSVFERINLPIEGITAKEILQSLIALRKEFHGLIWLEILFCRGINDQPEELARLRQAVEAIKPDQIQINTVVRPPAVEGIISCSAEQLEQIAAYLGAEAVGYAPSGPVGAAQSRSLQKRLIEMLKRRPCTLDDLAQAVGLNRLELVKILDNLVHAGSLQARSHQGRIYYQAKSQKG